MKNYIKQDATLSKTLHNKLSGHQESLHDSIRIEVEWLLNSHTSLVPIDTHDNTFYNTPYNELEKSIFSYGMHDISTISTDSTADIQSVCDAIQKIITNNESRLANIIVTWDAQENSVQPIAIHIQGTYKCNNHIQALSFESYFNPINQSFNIKSAA